jgi:hypothetical protein
MSRQTLIDARDHTIGYIDTTPDARHHMGGHGNLLASLIACR